jgi:hypothetical protein
MGLAPVQGMSSKVRTLLLGALAFGTAGSLGGCYAHAGAEPAYVETTYVPAHVETYPSYYYEGRTVYLIDERWYYRQPTGRWVYYREEPPTLYRQRMVVRQAPPARPRPPAAPAHHREAPVRDAPPAYYREDGRRVAPPAPKPHKRHDHDDDGDRGHDDRDGRRDDDDRRGDRDHGDRHDHDRDGH